ncbi:MAG: hypothetical protein ACR2K6_06000 [Solirubrobacterales bacterium]
MAEPHDLPEHLREVLAHQPRASLAVASALAGNPTHAYALIGPAGSGKRAAARGLAAELLAQGSADPDRARARGLAVPSPHPDLVWLSPSGNQHLVDDVREGVIGAVHFRPFEGHRRVFVIEAADAMAEESQNALLKTLEEPPSYAHLILISAEPDGLLETVRSRCRRVDFQPLPPDVAEAELARRVDAPAAEIAAAVALAGGDLDRAELLLSEHGRRLRELVERSLAAALAGELASRPWAELSSVAADIGAERGREVELAARAKATELGKGRDAARVKREGAEAAKRADRRARTEVLDLALGLCVSAAIDLIALAEGGGELVRNGDRIDALQRIATDLDQRAAREAADAAMDARRRLRVNANEELALDAVFHRVALALGDRLPVG